MINVIYRNYDKLKPKQKKAERSFSYHNQMLVQLGQIVRIDNFLESLDLDLDIAINIKLVEGVVGFTKVNDTYYTVFAIQPAGLPRKDGRPYKVVGTYLDDNQNVVTKEYNNDEDIVLWYNNGLMTGEGCIDFFAYMLTETDVSMQYNIERSRYNPYIKVKNEKQKQQYVQAMQDTHDGKPIVIVDDEGNNPFNNGNNELTVDVNDVKNIDKIQYLSNYHSHLISRFGSLYGFNMDISSKQSEQTEKEISKMDAYSWCIPIDMLNQAKEFCDRMKKLYDVELVAHFGTVHEFNFAKFTTDCTADDDTMNADINTVDQDVEMEEGEKDGDGERDLQPLQDEQ